jgi:rare lipoprotein A (peptidoglycan hydrolase)
MVMLALAVTAAIALMPTTATATPKVWAPALDRHARVVKPLHMGWQLSTWYGPGFWGNTTACGIPLEVSTWGIAHRTLPCGKLVWLRRGGREIVVPVIDRGPYSGATVDLTRRTSNFLRVTKHGAATVRMTVLQRTLSVRQLHRANKLARRNR